MNYWPLRFDQIDLHLSRYLLSGLSQNEDGESDPVEHEAGDEEDDYKEHRTGYAQVHPCLVQPCEVVEVSLDVVAVGPISLALLVLQLVVLRVREVTPCKERMYNYIPHSIIM